MKIDTITATIVMMTTDGDDGDDDDNDDDIFFFTAVRISTSETFKVIHYIASFFISF